MKKTTNNFELQNPVIAEERSFWLETSKDTIRKSLESLDNAAKQIIGATSILEGLYFNAIAFGNLHGKVQISWLLAIYLAPIGLLLVSLTAGLMVLIPKRRYPINIHSSDIGRLVYEYKFNRKSRSLKISSIFLVLGIMSLFFAVLVYLVF